MNYIGSKNKLSAFIKDSILNTVKTDISTKVFCDIFAGTGIIARTFKKEVKQVISNDIEHYSYVLNKNYIENHLALPESEKYISELNSLALSSSGFIYNNYCLGSGSGRQYFSDANGKKIDTIRSKIEQWKKQKNVSSEMYYFLLASLLESADKVANTASVYGAFLKHLKKSAQKEMTLKPALFEINDNTHKVHNKDSNELIKEIKGDILYLDPPYNHREYGANYHLLNTIAKYDEFTPKGKTGLREYAKSKYCKKAQAKEAFDDLLCNADFEYIFLSYNNEGIMQPKEIKDIMNQYGSYNLLKKEYQRFKADKTENRNHTATSTYEYLHILQKK